MSGYPTDEALQLLATRYLLIRATTTTSSTPRLWRVEARSIQPRVTYALLVHYRIKADSSLEVSDVSFYQPIYDALVQQLGCGRSSGIAALQCLRNTPGSELQATLATAPYNTSFNPLIDGIFLPYYPSAALAKGAFARIPILIGTNTGKSSL